MNISHQNLISFLNALYELGERTITVKHPSSEIGELLRINLSDPAASTVSVTTDTDSYNQKRLTFQHHHGSRLKDELPNESAYVKTFVRSGLVDIDNRDEVDQKILRHGYQDLQAGHPPLYAGFDTNLFAWQMDNVLNLDPEVYTDDKGRSPVNGYVLPTGIKEELTISYRYGKNEMSPDSLADALGTEFKRLNGQPIEDNRETRLGLKQYRRLRESRPNDIVETDTGDQAIIGGCAEYYEDEQTDVILFSNDGDFPGLTENLNITSVKVDFPENIPQQLTGSWDQIATLLYIFAIIFGVIILPRATLYGAWEAKTPQHWRREEIDVEARSPKLQTLLERDEPIVDTYRNGLQR